MSVPEARREVSKVEYVYNAVELYKRVLLFLKSLSAKAMRLIGEDTKKLAFDIASKCSNANGVYVNSKLRCDIKETYLVEAKATLMTLETQLYMVYELLMSMSPHCFETSSKRIPSKKSVDDKINAQIYTLTNMIIREHALLKGMLGSIINIRKNKGWLDNDYNSTKDELNEECAYEEIQLQQQNKEMFDRPPTTIMEDDTDSFMKKDADSLQTDAPIGSLSKQGTPTDISTDEILNGLMNDKTKELES